MDQYYDVIGFLVKAECEYKGNRLTTYGFRSVYFGKCDSNAPVDFDDGYNLNPEGRIGNGFGDHVEILEILKNKDQIDECININKIDINKYLKAVDLLLAEKSSIPKDRTHSSLEV